METSLAAQEHTRQMLRELGFSVRHTGYQALCIAIPHYANNKTQRITKDLYPTLKKQFGYRRTNAIERPIRYAISEAWEHGSADVWAQYFPRSEKAPSNLDFIATMAEHLQ